MTSLPNQLEEDLLRLVSVGLLEQTEGCEDVYSNDMLVQTQSRGLCALEKAQAIYGRAWSDKGLVKNTCTASVILCATYLGDYEWSDEPCQKAAAVLLKDLVTAAGSPTLVRLLCGYSEVEESPDEVLFPRGIAREVFQLLKTRMNKENWKKEPASRQVFSWVLTRMEHPFVGEHLNLILPPALLLVDDYLSANKLLGVRCLQHLVNEVDATELRWYGRGEVVYQALEPLLYQQDAALMSELLPCIIGILAVIEHKKESGPREPNRYDKVFQVVLGNMEGEQKIALRRAFAKFLSKFVAVLGIYVLCHMKRLMRVVVSYLEVSDGEEETSRLCILEALKSLITEAWPRIPAHSVGLTKVLLALLSEIDSSAESFTTPAQVNLMDKTEECLVLLRKCSPDMMQPTLEGIMDMPSVNDRLKKSLSKVLKHD